MRAPGKTHRDLNLDLEFRLVECLDADRRDARHTVQTVHLGFKCFVKVGGSSLAHSREERSRRIEHLLGCH